MTKSRHRPRYISRKKKFFFVKSKKRTRGNGAGLGMVAAQIAPMLLAELFK